MPVIDVYRSLCQVRGMPPIHSTATGVRDDIRILRDEWGVAHIRAGSADDAFFAQGYVHAQDRLWHMDCARKQMEGRWAEWVGAPGVPLDAQNRRMDAAGASRRDYAALSDEARRMVDSYAAGVNAWLAQAPLPPLEYRPPQSEQEQTGDDPVHVRGAKTADQQRSGKKDQPGNDRLAMPEPVGEEAHHRRERIHPHDMQRDGDAHQGDGSAVVGDVHRGHGHNRDHDDLRTED